MIQTDQLRETVEQHSVNFEETRALYESLYQNLAVEVEKVNSVNRKLKETNADLTTELARGVGHFARDCTARLRRRDAAYLQTQLLISQKEEAGIQLQAEEYDLMAYTELLEPIPEPQQVPQNDNNVIFEATDVEQDGKIVEQHSANFEETRALYESLY
nr:hypothetical protein [Tanacetum cinerariifolium]